MHSGKECTRPAIYNLLFLLSTRVQYTTSHQALAVICGESCSCSSCLSTSEIVGPQLRELANLGTRPRGRGRGSRYREAEAKQQPRTQTVLWQEPYPTPIMICDMQYVMGRVNAICDANTLWATRMRYVICEYATGRVNAILLLLLLNCNTPQQEGQWEHKPYK